MKQVSITKAVKIKNQRVKTFNGEKEYLATGGLIGDKVKTEKVTYKTKPSRADLLVTENQLIIARMKETNKVLLIDENTSDLIVSTGFLVLDVQEGWHPGFLFHYFVSSFFQKQKDKLSIGATQKAINNEKFKEILIPKIPFEDQKRIVKILDEADALRQKRKQAIGLLDDYLKSVFLEMFGDPVKNEKSWETKKTSEVITEKAQNGFFAKNEHYSEFGTPVIWISDFINLPYARVKNLKRANATSKDKQQYKVKYGDVLFCRSSLTVEGIGRCSIIPENIPEDTIYECHIIKISLNKEIILPEYFREFSKTAYFRNQIMQKAKTSTMTTIAQGGILETSLLIPPMELQKSFLNVIKKQEILIDKMLLQSAGLETQFQALIQKAFKGEL
jgi:restriction endonuclease S subunit